MLHFPRSISAQGRLEQPLTYWNAMGELAALGFVLCARAGRRREPAAAAAGARRPPRAAPLGMGLYLSFSRGALFACAAGLVALVVLAPRREQLRALLVLRRRGRARGASRRRRFTASPSLRGLAVDARAPGRDRARRCSC